MPSTLLGGLQTLFHYISQQGHEVVFILRSFVQEEVEKKGGNQNFPNFSCHRAPGMLDLCSALRKEGERLAYRPESVQT